MSEPQTSNQAPIIVVGSGVIGAACAYYLSEAGFPVKIIDQGTFGQGCSHGNCGFVSPSHILPLCRPGAISSSLKTLFQKNSPFLIRPRLDLSLWSWFLKFARHCNSSDMIAGGRARHAMLQSARHLYNELFQTNVLTECEWETRGLLFVHHDQRHFDNFAQTDELLRKEFGLGAVRLEASQLLELEPALKPVVAGAWLYECDAHLRPHLLMRAWRNCLLSRGVEIHENCRFLELETKEKNQIAAIQTSQGRMPCEQIIFATGAWSRLLNKQLKLHIPIEPGKGYSITMPRPARCPNYPMIFEDHRVAVTPTETAYRIGSTMEFAGFDTSLREDRLKLLTNAAQLYLHDPLCEPMIEKWYGWRPMSSDGVPWIGRLPHYQNGWLAAGHSMLGVSMAPATGKLIAEMITGAAPHLDPHPYRLDR